MGSCSTTSPTSRYALRRCDSAPVLFKRDDARTRDVFTRIGPTASTRLPPPLITDGFYRQVYSACRRHREAHATLDLKSSASFGALAMQGVGLALTAAGLGMGFWVITAAGIAAMVLCVTACVIYYTIARAHTREARLAAAEELRCFKRDISARLNDPVACSRATEAELSEARALQNDVQAAIAEVNGGMWYAMKQVIYGSMFGGVVRVVRGLRDWWRRRCERHQVITAK